MVRALTSSFERAAAGLRLVNKPARVVVHQALYAGERPLVQHHALVHRSVDVPGKLAVIVEQEVEVRMFVH